MSDQSLQPGQVFQDRYLILGKIGQGGMGAVYQARDLHFANVRRICAVKEMVTTVQDARLREQMMRSFEREAEILATLSHPAIPKIFDYFRFGDCAYLVQEFIEGRDLASILANTDAFIPVKQVLKWAVDLCDVLTYLHGHTPEPIIFRDMKPGNIMIDHRRAVRLIDFGIARTLQPNRLVTTVGTKGYAAPEVYGGEADARADIYSLGATLHHLLTRVDPQLVRPFSFDERPIPAYNAAVSPALAAVVMRALSFERDPRFASAEAFKQTLLAADSAEGVTPDPSAAVTRPHMNEDGTRSGPPATGFDQPSRCLWSFATEDAVRTRPLLVRDEVYVGSNDNNLWALDAHDGSLRWKYATGGPIVSSPTYGGGSIYVGSSDKNLYALDAQRGRFQWRFATGGEIHTRPAYASGLVFVGSDDGRLYAVRPALSHAQKMWDYDFLTPIRSSPAVEDGRIYSGSDSGEMVCLDLSGVELWRLTGRRRILSSPLVHNHQVYLGANDFNVYAVDADHPLIAWSFRTRSEVISSAACADGRVLVGSTDGTFYALDAQTGRELWRRKIGQPVTTTPAVSRDTVYFGALDGVVYALHVGSGEVVWQFQTQGPISSSPAVSGGVVYIGSDDHRLYALQA